MGGMRKELIQKIEQELTKWDGLESEIDWAYRKHARLILRYKGKSRFIIMSKSPSDYRGIMNKIRDIRHAAILLGCKQRC